MSLRRVNHLMLTGVLPFNFGMTYEDWVRLYKNPSLQSLVGSDPATWTPERIERVNAQAKEEKELYERLMALSDEEFYNEVDRLSQADDSPSEDCVSQS